MSKAFTKEDDGAESDRLEDLPQSSNPNYVTPAGLAALNDRLDARRAALVELKAHGDDFDSRFRIAVAQRDIRFLEERITRAILIDPKDQPPGIVAFGARVEVLDSHGVRHTYRIVGEDEADPERGLISPFSPLAAALTGAQIGDTVEWRKPAGTVELEVAAIVFS